MSPESNLGHYKLAQGGCFHRCASPGLTLPLHSASLAPLFINIEYLPTDLPTDFVETVGTMSDPPAGTTSMKTVDDRFCIPLLNKDNAKMEFDVFLCSVGGKLFLADLRRQRFHTVTNSVENKR